MVIHSVCAGRGGGVISIPQPNKLSAFNSAIPTSILFPRKKNSSLFPCPLQYHSKNVSLCVKNQYLTPQDQNHEQQKFTPYDSRFPSQPGQFPPRVYVGYSVYKGKAALTVEPRPPEFSPLDSGAFKLSKEGYVLLQFAPASGVRQYDWSRKQVFSLSVTEIGHIISLGASNSCEFFHDPNKGKSDEGRVRKVLKVEPLPDSSGHFFNLSVQNKITNVDEKIYIPITKAEFAVLVSSFNFVLPYLLGWHTFANSIKPEDANRLNSTNPRSSDFEWTR
ncbi:single-stranded DNA-binding protein WHY1, chloroplastic isoform X2 [Salvia miltiorrhiza]|uniref:single-stranded DNA-binding protein WHY1, chloroplastic isoform X2 n=1 Tax=Salvia miltiorrhiza TaxID=226208 RepID=UPI0025AB68B0|nr:single-stranded DNA-binding protein WHY1, chloroplastic isoform X2 [Salvia miltiorrhiza]